MDADKQLSEHFKSGEFACPCCGGIEVDPELIVALEKIRAHFGNKVIVTSGYRCKKHNREVGGAADSFHCRGMAADIQIEGVAPALAADCAESILGDGGGVGRYSSWTHVDVRAAKARWSK